MTAQELQHKIEQAAQVIGKTWPLYSFVTANPLSGYEDRSFFEAVEQAGNALDAQVLPEAQVIRQAWEEGLIDSDEIKRLLREAGKTESPEHYLKTLEAHPAEEQLNVNHELDRLTVKWLSLFMDEGMAAWPMPFKEQGFYTAWRKLIKYDEDLKTKSKGAVPKSPEQALSFLLKDYNDAAQATLLERHLAALPGWAGFIKYRVENKSVWNAEYPVDLLAFLAVRLWMAHCLDIPLMPAAPTPKNHALLELKYLWLQAWEGTWQKRSFKKLEDSVQQSKQEKTVTPEAQLVFCLDSRSEVLRRHLEAHGNYETFGSAGSFGVPMNYRNLDNGLINKSMPAMAPSKYLIHEEVIPNQEQGAQAYKTEGKRIKFYTYFLKRMKNILPSAFGYVEGSGFYYGFFMLMRLFNPVAADRMQLQHKTGGESVYEPHIHAIGDLDGSAGEIAFEEQATIVKNAFDSCGWRQFAPLVVFTGHASHSANNPYASSLDCGACAGNPGKRNARILARMANAPEVREILRDTHGITVPEDTIFIAGEHTTSTDNVELFDSAVPESHQAILQSLKKVLVDVKHSMTKERLNEGDDAASLAKIKATSWSESRPEWGLSKHAGYIIGPRSLTKNNEFSDWFSSSYDWKIDNDGAILAGLMQGPLVVCQWINNHYYFSTVDNDKFGAGSKITHNITGKYGVMQGNGSDLKVGLPLQSLMKTDDKVFHNPLRLSTVIQAPKDHITKVLANAPALKTVIDNGWIHLFVMDPEHDNVIEQYRPEATWAKAV